jgi:hypothetical protein
MKELLFLVPVILGTVGKIFKHYISDELLKIVYSEACVSWRACALREQRSAALLLGKERSVMNCGI